MPDSPNFKPGALLIALSPNHAVHTRWRWWWTRRLTRRRTRRWKLFALPSCNCAVTTTLVSTRAHQSHQPRGPARHCNAEYNALTKQCIVRGCLECHGSVQQSAVKCNVAHTGWVHQNIIRCFSSGCFSMHISLCNFALQRIRCDVQYGAEWTLLSVADTSVGSPPLPLPHP